MKVISCESHFLNRTKCEQIVNILNRHDVVSDLGLHCLLVSYKEDSRFIWVNIKLHFISHVLILRT